MIKDEDTDNFDLDEFLKDFPEDPNQVRQRENWDRVVRRHVKRKIMTQTIIHTTAIILAAFVLIAGIAGYIKWYYAVPLSLIAFLLFFNIGKMIASKAFDVILKRLAYKWAQQAA